jgi:hypothetical protein
MSHQHLKTVFKTFSQSHPNIKFFPPSKDNPLSPYFISSFGQYKSIMHFYYRNIILFSAIDPWGSQTYDLIKLATQYKFQANLELQNILRNTDLKNLVYLSHDRTLGIGYNNIQDAITNLNSQNHIFGANYIGRALMETRYELTILNKKKLN